MKCGTITLFTILILSTQQVQNIPEWSFLTYIQGDNDLAHCAPEHMNAIEKMGSTDHVNLFAQIDLPRTNITYRKRFMTADACEDYVIEQDRGYNPAREIIESMRWVNTTSPSHKYGLIIWSHNNGAINKLPPSPDVLADHTPSPPGITLPKIKTSARTRSTLFDYPNNTPLSTAGLGAACSSVASILGKKIAFLGLDASYMASIEVAYEIKDSVEYVVTSQHRVPHTGFPYSAFFSALTAAPASTPERLTEILTAAYARMYTKIWHPAYTLSATNVELIESAAAAFQHFLATINTPDLSNKSGVAAAIIRARSSTQAFQNTDFIDLIHFYEQLTFEITTHMAIARKRIKIFKKRDQYLSLLQNIINAIELARAATRAAIVISVSGRSYSDSLARNQNANGLSIYFPENGLIHPLYRKTRFAKNTDWIQTLKVIHSAYNQDVNNHYKQP